MNELIKISDHAIDGGQTRTVNARDLHAFLEVGRDFSNWIKAQIERARLLEGRDFLKEINIAQKGERQNQGLSRIEYHLSLDAAKHIGMLSGTEKGFQIREYFIECERRAVANMRPLSPEEMIVAQAQRMLEHKREIDAAHAKADAALLKIDAMAGQLQAATGPVQQHTIMGYAAYRGDTIDLATSQMLGRRAALLTRRSGIPAIPKVGHQIYGKCGVYHDHILEEIFNDYSEELDEEGM